MLRKLILAVCAISLTLASCGRQVTFPKNATGVQPGFIQFKIQTVAPPDFSTYEYVVALNFEGQEPYARNAQPLLNWQNLDAEIIVNSLSGTPAATVVPFLFEPGGNGTTIRTPGQVYAPGAYAPQSVIVTAPCGTQNTFCITIDRTFLQGIVPSPTPSPSPSASTSPCPTSSPSSSPSVSPSPTTSPSSGPSPSASPVATAPPGCLGASVWAVNYWVAQPGAPTCAGGTSSVPVQTCQVIAAPYGPGDVSQWNFAVDTSQVSVCYQGTSLVSSCTWNAGSGWTPPSSQSAQLLSGQIINNP